MIKTFTQAVKYLEGFIPTPDKKHPGRLGLERMKLLMNLLDNPQNTYPTIHVGGTSGKGSTATIIASILATKLKVGLHTSPHLVKINERIKIYGSCRSRIPNSASKSLHFVVLKDSEAIFGNPSLASPVSKTKDVTDEEFVRLVNEIESVVKQMEMLVSGAPSYFEIVTAMAFLYFKKQKVDFAVIEVGMGGKFDATNVIKPLVAVLTNVGLDHTEVLGDTVEKIAVDKAGIIKAGIKVVTGARQPSVLTIISAKCKVQSAKLSLLHRDFTFQISKTDEKGSIFDYFGNHTYKNLKLSLLGEHQVENAVLAIRTIELLSESSEVVNRGPAAGVFQTSLQTLPTLRRDRGREASFGIPSPVSPLAIIKENLIRDSLTSVFIPGRLEIVQKHPTVILDGAHNPDKMKALVTAIKTIYSARPVISVVAIKEDKKSEEMLRQLLKISKKVIFTSFQLTADSGIIKSYDPNELLNMAQSIEKTMPLLAVSDARDVVEKTIKSAKEDDIILVTGSLYLIGEIKKLKFQNPNFKSISND